MKKSDNRYNIIFISSLLVVLADQASKWLVVRILPEHSIYSVIPSFFNIVHFRNRGAAFGFLNSPDIEWQFWLFMLAAVVAMLLIAIMAKQAAYEPYVFVALGLIAGGALGNLIDRVRFRSVVDFLDFSFKDWHWPAFNLADSAICIGAMFVCWHIWHNPQNS